VLAGCGGDRATPGSPFCLREGGGDGCRAGRALKHASWVTVGPDGRSVYVGAPDSGAVAVFRRASGTGALVQLRGHAGCVARHGAEGCAPGVALATARPVAVSPDGRNVYAGTGAGVAVFARDPATGALRQRPGGAGCMVENREPGCSVGRGLANVRALIVSRDGRFLYVATNGSNTVTVFARAPGSGDVRQLPGAAGCLSQLARSGCGRARGLNGGRGVALSPDQRFAYVTAESGSSVAVFARSARTGALRQLPGRAGCLQPSGHEGCARARALANTHELVMSRDGRFAYVAADDSNGVTVLARNRATGTLRQLPGRAGCVQDRGHDGCARGRALGDAHSLALTPDGRLLYVVANASDAIAVFAVDRRRGTLRQLPGQRGCIGSSPGCTPSPGLDGVHQVAISPDGRNVYAASEVSSAVVTLAR
jgi:6-phosphogluconolactonase (cycloisomerase 2 family)